MNHYMKNRLGCLAVVVAVLGGGGRLVGLKPAQLPANVRVNARRGFLGRWHLTTNAHGLEYHASAWTLGTAKHRLARKVWPR